MTPNHTPQNPLLTLVEASLQDAKAEEITVLDLKGKTDMADYMVIANGTSSRHVITVADKLIINLKHHAGFHDVRSEGRETGNWVLVDAFDVIIHIFRPEVRGFYNLEKMWTVDIPDAAMLQDA